MKVTISWTTHNRRYTISLRQFLKQMEIDVTDEKIHATARRLLEQNELKQEE